MVKLNNCRYVLLRDFEVYCRNKGCMFIFGLFIVFLGELVIKELKISFCFGWDC